MKVLALGLILLGLSGVWVATSAHGSQARPQTWGTCFRLANCAGIAFGGTMDDIQCRNLGGLSMQSGGFCENL